MACAQLTQYKSCGVTLYGDLTSPYGVNLSFSTRLGGVSKEPFTSLNLGLNCNDNPDDVNENRRRLLEAMGYTGPFEHLVNPVQVHGDTVVVLRSDEPDDIARAQAEVLAGADAVVCTAKDVPVLLCYADCVPVILVAPSGFAVIHSGWRGTLAKISGKACKILMDETGCDPADILCYVGPHIQGEDYEVSSELIATFVAEFGSIVQMDTRNLDMSAAIKKTLVDLGVEPSHMVISNISTPQDTRRFYSYRKEEGICGRHGAIAYLSSSSR